jgi:hypothetical protein
MESLDIGSSLFELVALILHPLLWMDSKDVPAEHERLTI